MWSMQYGLFPQLFLRNMRRVRKGAKYDFGRGHVPHNTICCSTDAEFKPKVPKYEISIIVNWTKPSLQILMYYFKIVNGRKHLLVLKAEFCKSFALKAANNILIIWFHESLHHCPPHLFFEKTEHKVLL